MIMLTEIQKQFLKGYQPKSRLFTSEEEVNLISAELGLHRKSAQVLDSIRNEVVEFYGDNFLSMWSVIAAIDFQKFQAGVSL